MSQKHGILRSEVEMQFMPSRCPPKHGESGLPELSFYRDVAHSGRKQHASAHTLPACRRSPESGLCELPHAILASLFPADRCCMRHVSLERVLLDNTTEPCAGTILDAVPDMSQRDRRQLGTNQFHSRFLPSGCRACYTELLRVSPAGQQ